MLFGSTSLFHFQKENRAVSPLSYCLEPCALCQLLKMLKVLCFFPHTKPETRSVLIYAKFFYLQWARMIMGTR